jgi:hypothetical protein
MERAARSEDPRLRESYELRAVPMYEMAYQDYVNFHTGGPA